MNTPDMKFLDEAEVSANALLDSGRVIWLGEDEESPGTYRLKWNGEDLELFLGGEMMGIASRHWAIGMMMSYRRTGMQVHAEGESVFAPDLPEQMLAAVVEVVRECIGEQVGASECPSEAAVGHPGNACSARSGA